MEPFFCANFQGDSRACSSAWLHLMLRQSGRPDLQEFHLTGEQLTHVNAGAAKWMNRYRHMMTDSVVLHHSAISPFSPGLPRHSRSQTRRCGLLSHWRWSAAPM
jgi:hypothetical protein